FNAPLPWTIEALRLTLEDSDLYGVASVTGGDDRFDDPLPVTLREGGAIEFVTERTELLSLYAVTIASADESAALPKKLRFDASNRAVGEVVATSGALQPGAYVWTARIGEVAVDGQIVVRPAETARVELDGLRWEARTATVLIDASALADPDPERWHLIVTDAADSDRRLRARIERLDARGSKTWRTVVDALPPGQWDVVMLGPRSERIDPPIVRLVHGGTAGPFVLTPARRRTVEVRVVDAATGEALRSARAWSLEGVRSETLHGGRNGIFRSVDLSAEAPAALFAEAAGYRLQQIDFEPMTSPDVVEFRMEKGWVGRVVVFDSMGFAAGVPVDVDGRRRGRTDAQGALWFEGDGPPKRIEVGGGHDDIEVVRDPFEGGYGGSLGSPGFVFGIRRR
ncbi:MAG: hypothetical protein AAGA20_21535, partial [Planctomycetota bacterium]